MEQMIFVLLQQVQAQVNDSLSFWGRLGITGDGPTTYVRMAYAIAAVGIAAMFYVLNEGRKAHNRNAWASYLVSCGIAGTCPAR